VEVSPEYCETGWERTWEPLEDRKAAPPVFRWE